jgi:hypothetical protein
MLATQQWIGNVLPATLLHMLNHCRTPLIAKLVTFCFVLVSLMAYLSGGHTQDVLFTKGQLLSHEKQQEKQLLFQEKQQLFLEKRKKKSSKGGASLHGGAPRHGASAVAASGRVILMRAWRCLVQGPRGELLSATGDSRARRTLENTAQRAQLCWSKRMSSSNPTKSQQACASKASLRRCTLWIFLSPRKWVEQTIHRAARPEI